jgi:hypothetical protein
MTGKPRHPVDPQVALVDDISRRISRRLHVPYADCARAVSEALEEAGFIPFCLVTHAPTADKGRIAQ